MQIINEAAINHKKKFLGVGFLNFGDKNITEPIIIDVIATIEKENRGE